MRVVVDLSRRQSYGQCVSAVSDPVKGRVNQKFEPCPTELETPTRPP